MAISRLLRHYTTRQSTATASDLQHVAVEGQLGLEFEEVAALLAAYGRWVCEQ